MASYSLIQRRLLKVEITSYTAQLLLLGNSIFSAVTLVFFLLQKVGLFSRLGINLHNFIIAVSFVSMLTGILSVICRAISVFHLDKIRKKIKEQEERALLLGDWRNIKKKNKTGLTQAGVVMQSWVQTLLLLGTACLSLLSIISTMSLLLYGAGHARVLTVFGVKMNPIIEWTGNIVYTIATYMSIGSFAILNRNTDFSNKKNRERLNRVLLLLMCNTLILIGIGIGYLEKKKIVPTLQVAGTFLVVPLGSVLITTSIVLFAVFSYGILKTVEARCDEIYEKILDGKRMASCLGCEVVLSQTLFNQEIEKT